MGVSFSEVKIFNNPDKAILVYDVDTLNSSHAAITIPGNTTHLICKMGDLPVFKHPIDRLPTLAGESLLRYCHYKYYKRNYSMNITGPDIVSGSATFTTELHNANFNRNSWQVEPAGLFQTASGTGLTANLQISNNPAYLADSATITFTLGHQGGDNNYRISKRFAVQIPTRTISGTAYSEGFTIKAGATVTVASTGIIKNYEGAIIRVPPSAKLVVNGATLTNATYNKLWQGIVVLGDPDQPQYPEYQGSVTLKNAAVVEHALCAISAAPDNAGGGIITATDAAFQNNVCAVEYRPYVYYDFNTGLFHNNVGKFTRCNFSIDNQNLFAANGKFFSQHVKMSGVREIKFVGCEFENKTGVSGKGIFALAAGFKILHDCDKNAPAQSGDDCECPKAYRTPTSFENFNYGVHYYNIGDPQSVFIDQSEFKSNTRAVQLESTDNYRLTRSDFYDISSYGLLSFSSSGYRIEENTFSVPRSSLNPLTNPWGIYMSNSGNANNAIYRNSFINLQRGIVINSSNSNSPSDGSGSAIRDTDPGPLIEAPRGLQINCNDFNDNNISIYLSSGSTIHSVQGNLLKGADNAFSGAQDHSIYMNNMQKITYFHSVSDNGGLFGSRDMHAPYEYTWGDCFS